MVNKLSVSWRQIRFVIFIKKCKLNYVICFSRGMSPSGGSIHLLHCEEGSWSFQREQIHNMVYLQWNHFRKFSSNYYVSIIVMKIIKIDMYISR